MYVCCSAISLLPVSPLASFPRRGRSLVDGGADFLLLLHHAARGQGIDFADDGLGKALHSDLRLHLRLSLPVWIKLATTCSCSLEQQFLGAA